MSAPADWGPSHQTTKRGRRTWFGTWMAVMVALFGFVWPTVLGAVVLLGGGFLIACFVQAYLDEGKEQERLRHVAADDPLAAVHEEVAELGGGSYLGVDDRGRFRLARRERAVLLLGPPRSGKTTAVIIPAIICHDGPAVCTSTKPDVAASTFAARGRSGRLWGFDPTGTSGARVLQPLRWSPVRCAADWDGAMLMARAMTAGADVGQGTTNGSHWAKRSQALLGPLLHAAAVDERDMETVVDWVFRHELDEAGILLEKESASRLAFGSLLGILNTEARERASIFSAAADALQAYTSEAALEAAKDPNFDPSAFVASRDTVYIHAPAEAQAAAAPLVCGLLAEIRRATYLAHRHGTRPSGRMLYALDEAANIAPLEELPQIASEGGGQGLTLIASFQDLSQARQRWGQAADGFLTLFGTKLILPGIADTRTLEAVSTALGEYDRKMVSTSSVPTDRFLQRTSRTVSTQRTRVLSPGEIARIPEGRGLHLDGVRWELITLTPAYAAEPWKTLTAPQAAS